MRRGFLAGAVVAAALGLGLGGSAGETIFVSSARPAILRWAEAVTITGGVGSGQAQIDVYIDGQTCGDGRWEVISGAHTGPGGGFTAELGAGINLLVRARAEGATSNVVKIQQRPSVTLQPAAAGNVPGSRKRGAELLEEARDAPALRPFGSELVKRPLGRPRRLRVPPWLAVHLEPDREVSTAGRRKER